MIVVLAIYVYAFEASSILKRENMALKPSSFSYGTSATINCFPDDQIDLKEVKIYLDQ